MKERRSTSVQQLIDNLLSDSNELTLHLHSAYWQQMIYEKGGLPLQRRLYASLTHQKIKEMSINANLVQYTGVIHKHQFVHRAPLQIHRRQVIKEVIICISGDLKYDHLFAVDCEGSAIRFVE